jgi:hypothetical protein
MFKVKKSSTSWEKIIRVYEQSNLGKAEFCHKQKISAGQFYYWCNKLRPDLKSEIHATREKESSFLPIKTIKKEETFTIKINNGFEIKFDSLPEATWIAKLLNSVEKLNDQH